MLQKIKYETINYGKYEKLKKMFLSSKFEIDEVKEFDLQYQQVTELPPIKCLDLANNLIILVLSNNCINKFDSSILIKYAPQLEQLSIANNKIEEIEDLVELGTLNQLWYLDYTGNPICEYLNRENQVKKLLFPEKYKKYDPVKIMKATYELEIRKNPCLNPKDKAENIENEKIVNCLQEEITVGKYQNLVSKYNHSHTLAKYAQQPCPVPRLSRFKNLLCLNNLIITKYDIVFAIGSRDIESVIENTKKEQLEHIPKDQQPQRFTNKHVHDQYLKKYKKKIDRRYKSDFYRTNNNAATAQEELGTTELANKQSKIIPAIKYEANIWEKPQDIINKDVNFKISMEKFKKQEQKHKQEKLEKKIKRNNFLKQRLEDRKPKIKQKFEKQGIPEPYVDSDKEQSSIESDVEVKRIFKSRQRKQPKPHLNLEEQESSFDTSESDVSEQKQNEFDSSVSSKDSSMDKEDEMLQIQKQQQKLQRKLGNGDDSSKSQTQKQDQTNNSNNQLNSNSFLKTPQKTTLKSAMRASFVVQQIQSQTQDKQQLLEKQGMSDPNFETGKLVLHDKSELKKKIEDMLNPKTQQKQDLAQFHQEKPKIVQKNTISNSQYHAQPQNQSNLKKNNENQQNLSQNQQPKNEQMKSSIQQNNTRDIIDEETVSKIDEDDKQQLQDINHKKNNEFYDDQQDKTPVSNEQNTQKNKQIVKISDEKSRNKKINSEHISAGATTALQSQQITPDKMSKFVTPIDKMEKSNQRSQHVQSNDNSNIFSNNDGYENNNIIQACPVQSFQINVQPNLKQNFMNQKIQQQKAQVVKASAVKNKIFQNRGIHTTQSMDKLKNVHKPDYRIITKPQFNKYQNSKNAEDQKKSQTMSNFYGKGKDIGSLKHKSHHGHSTSQGNFNQKQNQNNGIQKADYDMVSLLPNQQQGFLDKFKQEILYDPQSEDHKDLKRHKKILEGAENLIRESEDILNTVKNNQNIMSIRSIRKIKEQKEKEEKEKKQLIGKKQSQMASVPDKIISYDTMFQHLQSDKTFQIQDSNYPAEKIIYQQTRKKSFPLQAYSTYDMRDIFYKVNNLSTQNEPKLVAKEIQDKINDPNLDIQTKFKLYEYLDVIEEIQLKKNKATQAHFKRLEKKEIERAENNAHLAYHFQKLKKYINDGEDNKNTLLKKQSEQIMKKNTMSSMFGVDQQSKIQYKNIQDQQIKEKQKETEDRRIFEPKSKLQMDDHKQNVYRQFFSQHKSPQNMKESGNLMSSSNNNKKKTLKLNKSKSNGNILKNQNKTEQEEDNSILTKMEVLKSKWMEKDQQTSYHTKNMGLQFDQVTEKINKGERVDWANVYYPSFEEMLENNLRKIQDRFSKNNQNGFMTVEQQMMKYASEFKQKIKEREKLKNNIDKYIKQGSSKLNEFFEWDEQQQDLRNDQDYCFSQYVKGVRDGQIQINNKNNKYYQNIHN